MTSPKRDYFELDPKHADPKRIQAERKKAQKLKDSNWWRTHLSRGVCHHCQKKFKASDLTMDHLLPIARGGESKPGNIVASCRPCNQAKGLESPVDALFKQLEAEKDRSK